MNVHTVLSSSSLDVLQDHFLVLKEYIRAPRAWYLQKSQHSSLVLQQAIKDLRSSPLLPLPTRFLSHSCCARVHLIYARHSLSISHLASYLYRIDFA
jgi:hypothetical protein